MAKFIKTKLIIVRLTMVKPIVIAKLLTVNLAIIEINMT
jgi:hypothetical protein